jgi:Lipocalin-like domain
MTMPSPQNNPLIGIWNLISAIAIYSDGTTDSEVYGANPTGYITYTAEGQMMVMFSRSNRPSFSQDVRSPFSEEMSAVPIEELAQAFTSFNAYAGTYTLNGNTVSHHLTLASIPNRVGTTLIRTFTISGDRITLRTPETINDGVEMVFELVWERLNQIKVSLIDQQS